MSRIVGGLFVLSAALAACTSSTPTKAIDCGPATALVQHPTSPELTGAPIGPLLIRGPFPAGATDATALGFVRGRPFKMLVLIARDMESDITLTGVRCSDGQPLRFWLNKGGGGVFPGGPASTPVPDDVMVTTADLRAVLPQTVAPPVGPTAFGGYMLFPTAGSYRIEGFAGDRKLGGVTLAISDEPYPAGQ